jgi:Tol biopolymer transport system component
VIFTGQGRGLKYGGDGTLITVVGARDDRYRIIRGEFEARAGVDTVLSADGRQVAAAAVVSLRPSVRIVDLVTGRGRNVGSGVAGTDMVQPVAWSPDGRAIVVRDTVPVDSERTAYRHVLSIVWPDDDRRTRLADTDEGLGSAVAFDPDGARLAFQTGRTVTVADLDGRRLSSFTLAPGIELAGKAAWSADGRTLTVSRLGIDSWTLGRVDAATGRDLGALDTPVVRDVTAIRLLGWAPDGSAWVVAYQPGPNAPGAFNSPIDMDQRLSGGNVGTVRVLALARASAPTTLLVAPDDVVSIDVSDAVV